MFDCRYTTANIDGVSLNRITICIFLDESTFLTSSAPNFVIPTHFIGRSSMKSSCNTYKKPSLPPAVRLIGTLVPRIEPETKRVNLQNNF